MTSVLLIGLLLGLTIYSVRGFAKINKRLNELDTVPKEVEQAVNQLLDIMNKDFSSKKEYLKVLEQDKEPIEDIYISKKKILQ